MRVNFPKKSGVSPISRAEKSAQVIDIIIYFLLVATIIYNSTTIKSLVDNAPYQHETTIESKESTLKDSVISEMNSLVSEVKKTEKNIYSYTSDMSKALLALTSSMTILILVFIQSGVRTDRLRRKIVEAETKYQDGYFVENVTDIYKEISEEIMERSGNKHLQIDVLAFTLHQITHLFERWQEHNKLKNITLNLYFLNPKYILQSKQINDNWESQLHLHLDTINKYIEENKDLLNTNNVKIIYHAYSHLPAINGIKVNDKYYIALASWNSRHQINDSDHAKYIRIMPDDRTKLGKHLKSMFNNWLGKSGSKGLYNPKDN